MKLSLTMTTDTIFTRANEALRALMGVCEKHLEETVTTDPVDYELVVPSDSLRECAHIYHHKSGSLYKIQGSWEVRNDGLVFVITGDDYQFDADICAMYGNFARSVSIGPSTIDKTL